MSALASIYVYVYIFELSDEPPVSLSHKHLICEPRLGLWTPDSIPASGFVYKMIVLS